MAKQQIVKKVVAKKMKISKETARREIEDALALFIKVVHRALETSDQGELCGDTEIVEIEVFEGTISAILMLNVKVSEEQKLEFGV